MGDIEVTKVGESGFGCYSADLASDTMRVNSGYEQRLRESETNSGPIDGMLMEKEVIDSEDAAYVEERSELDGHTLVHHWVRSGFVYLLSEGKSAIAEIAARIVA
eukprot:13915422-Alexandrium_andersonii.AAC.1